MLGGGAAMERAPMLVAFPLDPFPFPKDGLVAPEVDVGGREFAEALVVAAVVVMLDEGVDLDLEIARQEGALEQDAVLQRLVPPLDLALGHRMMRRAADMAHAPVGQHSARSREM